MNRVLLISPDQSWVEKTSVKLHTEGFQCDYALTGKEAQLKAYKNPFDYIFLDLKTTAHSGIEVFKYLRTLAGQHMIFLMNPDELSETELLRQGATRVLSNASPESVPQHIRSLGKIKVWENSAPVTSSGQEAGTEATIEDERFTRLKIAEFFEDTIAVTDFYIRLGTNRYVKIFNRGEKTSGEQLKKYATSGQKYIYFPTSDRHVFISFQNDLARKAIAGSNNPGGIVVKAMKSASEKLVEELRDSGIQPQLLEEGKQICQNMFESAMRDRGLRELINEFEKFDPKSFSDSFLVSFFSTVICKNIEWVGTRTIDTLALGALLHDIGTLQLEEEIRMTDYDRLTDAQVEKFKKHPELGVEALKEVPRISTAVLAIVQQHHEYVDGSGFPLGLTSNRIFPLAKIVSLADGLTDYIKENEVPVKEGLRGFFNHRENLMRYEPELVKNLIRGFKG